mmetsp:Transcript_63245/g.140969  ORF Transcript_63245/g.140969 Transcript_63245/m.140969 type:complete len:92 (-) Transcript_63245:460-735(-)
MPRAVRAMAVIAALTVKREQGLEAPGTPAAPSAQVSVGSLCSTVSRPVAAAGACAPAVCTEAHSYDRRAWGQVSASFVDRSLWHKQADART